MQLTTADIRWTVIVPFLPAHGPSADDAAMVLDTALLARGLSRNSRRRTRAQFRAGRDLAFIKASIAQAQHPRPWRKASAKKISKRFYDWCSDWSPRGSGSNWAYLIAVWDEAEEVGDFNYPPNLPDGWDDLIDRAYDVMQGRKLFIEARDVLTALKVIFHDITDD